MTIKKNEGETILTICKAGLVAIALCGTFGVYSLVENSVAALGSGVNSLADMMNEGREVVYTDMANAKKTVLYYAEPDENDAENILHRYKQYYVAGEEGQRGLYDAARNQILPNVYQDIVVLPYAYALKEDGVWRFYDKDDPERLLSEEEWDEVAPEVNAYGKYSTKLICVCRDQQYGAVDQYGKVRIKPRWDELQLNTLNVLWPLSRVKKDGLYGFIDEDGDVIVEVKWPYAAMETVKDEETGAKIPVIYVYDGQRWGGIVQNDRGKPAQVDWELLPGENYQAEHTPGAAQ
ncbi:MAG: WG repeat-containing protein [Firmicutes bacterium]|nr:WG repeat-containing protein [Bacillota bacterium]